MPNVYNPSVASTLNPIGNGFCVLNARGMLEPARMMDASSASSVPYGDLLRSRSPPVMYCSLC